MRRSLHEIITDFENLLHELRSHSPETDPEPVKKPPVTYEMTKDPGPSKNEPLHTDLPPEYLSILQRDPSLLRNIDFSSTPGCWMWVGKLTQGTIQHPNIYEGNRRRPVRRMLFTRFFGEDILEQENLKSTAHCGFFSCVNPFHAMSRARFQKLLETKRIPRDQMQFMIDWDTCFLTPEDQKPFASIKPLGSAIPRTDYEPSPGYRPLSEILNEQEVAEEETFEEDEERELRTTPAPLKTR